MIKFFWSIAFLALISTAACLPVPVSTAPFHPREERPAAVVSALSENYGLYTNPVFNGDGSLLAVYDSGSDLIRIFRSADLSVVRTHRPEFRPRRLTFSPKGKHLVIQSHAGWIDAYLKRKTNKQSTRIALDSPDAVKDDIQRVEVWEFSGDRAVTGLACDAVVSIEPKGGWLWASNWAITPGSRSSALLDAHFSEDEAEFSVLCWNGVRQRWDVSRWERRDDLLPPAFWQTVMGATAVQWMVGSDAASRSADGRRVLLAARERSFGFPTLYMWDRTTDQAKKLSETCGARLLPVSAISADGRTTVLACNSGMGYELRLWDSETGLEYPLKNADFGFAAGHPVPRGEGVALSPDGRLVAAVLLEQKEALLPNVFLVPAAISDSNLRLWSVADRDELVTVQISDLSGGADYFIGIDLAFSPDNKTLAVSGRQVRIYRVSDLDTRRQ